MVGNASQSRIGYMANRTDSRLDEQSSPVQVLLEEPSVALVHAVQPAGLDEHARPLHVFEEEVENQKIVVVRSEKSVWFNSNLRLVSRHEIA